MAAYSFEEWRTLPKTVRAEMPGVAILANSPLYPRDMGLFWAPGTRANAITAHAEMALTSDDPFAATAFWQHLKRTASEAQRLPFADRQAEGRRASAVEAALGADPDLTGEALDLSIGAEITAVDWLRLRGTHSADPAIDAEQRRVEFLKIIEGAATATPLPAGFNGPDWKERVDNVKDAETLLRVTFERLADLAPEPSRRITGNDGRPRMRTDDEMAEARTNERRRFLTAVTSSFSTAAAQLSKIAGREQASGDRALTPVVADRRADRFAVRAASRDEAAALETLLNWAAEQNDEPTVDAARKFFAAYRDDSLGLESLTPVGRPAMAIIVANRDDWPLAQVLMSQSETAAAYDRVIIAGPGDLLDDVRSLPMTTAIGQPTIDGGARVLSVDPATRSSPESAATLVFVPIDSDAPAADRSLAVQAVVGRANTVMVVAAGVAEPRAQAPEQSLDEVAATARAARLEDAQLKTELSDADYRRMKIAEQRIARANALAQQTHDHDPVRLVGWTPFAAQAFNAARAANKLELAIVSGGAIVRGKALRGLADEARFVDRTSDPDRYFSSRRASAPFGTRAILVDGSRVFKSPDVISERIEALPKHAPILVMDHKDSKNGYQHPILASLDEHSDNRPILYAEVTRASASMTSLETTGDGSLARRTIERELEVRLYDGPKSDRGRRQLVWDGENNDALLRSSRGAPIIKFSADARQDPSTTRHGETFLVDRYNRAFRESDAYRMVQEAMVERAAGVVILDDMGSDSHSAALTRLAVQMGRTGLVVTPSGGEMSLQDAHLETSGNTWQPMKRERDEINSQRDIELGSDRGHYLLGALPGDNRAAQAHYGRLLAAGQAPTLGDLLDGRLPDDKMLLSPQTREALDSPDMPKIFAAALNRASRDDAVLAAASAGLYRPWDADNPFKLERPVMLACTDGGDPKMGTDRIVALIGEDSQPVRYRHHSHESNTGPRKVDEITLKATIDGLAKRGHGIALALAPGVPATALRLALENPDAKLFLVLSGAPKSYAPEMAALAEKALARDHVTLVMPERIAPVIIEPTVQEQAAARRVANERIEELSREATRPMGDITSVAAKGGEFKASSFAENVRPERIYNAATQVPIDRFQRLIDRGVGADEAAVKARLSFDRDIWRAEDLATPRVIERYPTDLKAQRSLLADISDGGVIVGASQYAPALATAAHLIAQNKPLGVMAAGGAELGGGLYDVAVRLAAGVGPLNVQDERHVGGLSSGGAWATLVDKSQETFERQAGEVRSNAGTFQTVRDAGAGDVLIAGERREWAMAFSGRAPIVGNEPSIEAFNRKLLSGEPTLVSQNKDLRPGWERNAAELEELNKQVGPDVRRVDYIAETTMVDGEARQIWRKVETVDPAWEAAARRAEQGSFAEQLFREQQQRFSDGVEQDMRFDHYASGRILGPTRGSEADASPQRPAFSYVEVMPEPAGLGM